MSERYSLRQTPKKTERAGFVETPRIRKLNSRRKSQFPESDGDDSSSATDSASTNGTSIRASRRKVSMVEKATTNSQVSNDKQSNGSATNHSIVSKDAVVKLDSESKIIVDGWEVGTDHKIDASGHFEFGGSFGASAMIIAFPLLLYYMFIGATFYDGKFPTPARGQSFVDFVRHMGNLIYEEAFPSARAWIIYWTFVVFEAACYCLLPGIHCTGKPLAHLGGKKLSYYCSAVWSFYVTIVLFGALHFSGIFPLYTIIDEFGPILSVAIASSYIVSLVAYFSAIARGAQHRMTGYPIYDFFMGAELNPRMFGILDFKMFFEVRLPWYILFALTCGAAARQYEQYGYVSGEVGFVLMAHFLYANACSKGEELIPTTWDMYYEKWGFMLIFWNLAGVPLSYSHCTLYLANHPPSSYHWNRYFLAFLFAAYLFVYWIWDTSNSQKNRFRAQENGTLVVRKTFPQLPWAMVKNPRRIKTNTGDSLLVNGWFGYARKIAYTCDFFFAMTWGLVTGFDSPFPWFYPVFFGLMIIHRASRDIQRCKVKYGESWDEYTKLVPYLFIPYVI